MALTSDGLVLTVAGRLRVDTTVADPVEEVGTEEGKVTKVKQTHTLDAVSDKLSGIGHSVTDTTSDTKTETNGTHNARTSVEALSEGEISRVGDRASG